ncbi:SDR family oxidoreductase [Paenibacillus hexagrammi]|uniref:SDR family oxidoreductase n=1 Tax=Paenibacillus hexagrammi TaxID=2908839 RepID=A0ABY3SGJ9_9BACL|nr:SDR family oxidoreductase [Paenibacillus sp. YPD9-1]UJF32585.1 SDR family oxidoreductase [Paenibacillus sp. YPD9-1]
MNIFITGANRGLGFALAKLAVERGYTVYAGARDPLAAGQLQELQKENSARIKPVALDVTSEESVAAAAQVLKEEGVSLHAIINNAAVLLGRSVPIEQLALSDVTDSFAVNLFGPMLVAKHFLPLLVKDSKSSFINISSEAGSTAGAYGGDYPYALTKAALNYFSLQIKRSLQAEGVQVYAVHPGWIQTDMGGAAAPGDPYAAAKGILDLMDRKVVPAHDQVFVDHTGEAMPL